MKITEEFALNHRIYKEQMCPKAQQAMRKAKTK